jgi:hypothetical protein
MHVLLLLLLCRTQPENVLFTDQRVLKLADFGLAIDLTEERAVTRAGTLVRWWWRVSVVL